VKQAKTKPRKYWGMTVHIEKEYFWGKAGLLRVVTLVRLSKNKKLLYVYTAARFQTTFVLLDGIDYRHVLGFSWISREWSSP